MVIKTKQFGRNFREVAPTHLSGPSWKDFSVTQPKQADKRPKRLEVVVREAEEERVDVIDLGAPRRLRSAPRELPRPPRRRAYTPNPRLYPGPAAKPKRRPRRAEPRGRARRRVFRRPLPNSRLYRPAPRRLPPPARPPRGPWPPPAPPARPLDTASRAALRLAARPPAPPPARPPAPPPARPPAPPPTRRLVVTLPAGAGAMDAARHSTSPDDCSDADALSAPSEFLAEFLSAIMRRQYAEALKYCRLILQYEPHNATARGFYPLLRHKLQREGSVGAGGAGGAGAGSRRGSGSDSSSSGAPRSPPRSSSRSGSDSRPQWSASAGSAGSGARSESGSVASQSSLELDSSSGSAGPASPARDANGNPQAPRDSRATADDLENDNDVSHLKSASSASLRRLRAQFACSIK